MGFYTQSVPKHVIAAADFPQVCLCVLVSGDQCGCEFQKINLIKKVPALRDGDFRLAER